MPSKYSNRKKENEQLGMPFTTASLRLHRMIMLSLAKQCGKSACFQCGKEIESVDQLSIEHKQPWLDNSVELFWDMNNIAFSHGVCNKRAGRKPKQWSQAAVDAWNKKFNTTKRSVSRTVAASNC